MYTNLVKNRVCRDNDGFHCTLCNVEVHNEEYASGHIVNDEIHIEHTKSVAPIKNFKISESQCNDLVNNGVIVISSKEFRCTFCSCPIPKLDHVFEHILGKKHINKCRKILSDPNVGCTTNSIEIPFENNINEEKDSSSHNENREEVDTHNLPSDQLSSNEQPPSNDISAHASLAQCNICQCHLDSNSAMLYHGMFHLSQRSSNITDVISFSMKKFKRIYCLLCDSVMNNEEDLEKHLGDIVHQKRMIILCRANSNTFMSMLYMSSAYYVVPPHMNNICDTLNAEFNKYLYYQECNMNNSAFQTTVQNDPTASGFIQYEMLSTNVLQQQSNVQQNIHSSIFPEYFCFMCNLKFTDENSLFIHYSYDEDHKYRIVTIILILKDKNMKFVTYVNNEVIKCLKCQIHLTDLHAALIHLFEIQHTMEKQMFNDLILANNPELLNNMYICPVCKVTTGLQDYMMVQHLESDYHKHNIQEYYTHINSNSFEKLIFYCPHCKSNFFSDKALLEHFHSNHGNNYKNVIHTNNVMVPNTAYMYLPTNNQFVNGTINHGMQPYWDPKYGNVNYMPLNGLNYNIQHNATNSNIDKSQHQEVTVTVNNQKDESNQNNANTVAVAGTRTKNLINFSPRYVKLCLEVGDENIFNIDPERIQKLELGLSLTFPYETNRGCIPCGHEISSDLQLLYEHLRTEEHEKNLQEMEDADELFENYRDQLSDLELAKFYMYEDSDEWIKCLTCDIMVENCDENMRGHMNSELHMNNYQIWKNSADEIFTMFNNIFENLWYYIEKFFCNICCAQFEFEVDYARHLESQKHLKEVEKRLLKNQSLQFDFCILCSSYWYAKSDHHMIHCGKDSHKYILKSRDFNVPDMTDAVKIILTSIEQTINNLLAESDKVILSDRDTEKNLLESVEMVVKSKYPQARAYLFGSRISYLTSQNSDLDVYIDCENQYSKITSKDECQDQLLVVQECFHKYQDIWVIDEIVLRTRVPLIKLRHRSTNLNCDISFINGLSVEKSKIVG